MDIYEAKWAGLPDHIIVNILGCLPMNDRFHAALTCSDWLRCFQSPPLWRHFTFTFLNRESRYLQCIDSYGQHLKSVVIALDQADSVNRELACQVLEELDKLKERRLTHLAIKFLGENPLFYSGKEFVDILTKLLGPISCDVTFINEFKVVDLSGLYVAYGDDLFNKLSATHPTITHLNIQNKMLVCKVTHVCILRLVQRCRKLKELCVYNCSLSDDVLLAFTEADRDPLEHLSILCRRQEKYKKKEIASASWTLLVKKLPFLRVTMSFDHTIPVNKVHDIMKPEVPVSVLRLETFTIIYDEVNMAASYYQDTLTKLVLQTRPSKMLCEALVNLAEKCFKLSSLHVFCVLEKETVDKIFLLHPEMKENGTFTLKWAAHPHPWIAGKDC